MNRLSPFNVVSLTLGFAFLYLPMLILVIYSFNKSKLVTVWAGFSTKWYGELLQNEAFLDAAWVTLKVAVVSSTFATILGTMAAYTLVRGGRFFGRTLFSGMIYAPLVMPEVITGLSLLLLFIGIGMDRGVVTIVLAHTTFSMCFVSVVVSSRLMSFDRSLEEAALDLGATPFTAFRLITLPIIAPAVVAGWLLAFTLSLDDLVIAQFVSGPRRDHPADEDMVICPAWGQPRNQRPQFYSDRIGVYRRDHSVARVQATLSADQARRTGRSAHYMRRIFSNYAYGPEPRLNCWWDNTCTPPNFPELGSNIKSDIAIIGGGFTGLNAAYHLAMAGLNVTVLEAQNIGWGASGRNGGFCCLGGRVATDAMLDKHYGREERLRYRQTEVAAIFPCRKYDRDFRP